MNFKILINIVICIFLWHSPVKATMPCPSPLSDQIYSDQSLRDYRRKISNWILVGTIEDVIHSKIEAPFFTDFATFSLRVIDWEKSSPKLKHRKKLKLQVGWCDNPPLPDDTSGKFRFYGINNQSYQESNDNNRLLYHSFERVLE